MTGEEVHAVLTARGITTLHHANSVITSASQIRLGSLASRGAVEANQLPQSWQYSDPDDKKFGIWNDVFLDAPDYHRRNSNLNQYGPVTFELHIEVLRSLPPNSRVLVARLNPTKWEGVTEEARYFMTAQELRGGFSFGTFDHMLVIRTPTGAVPFGNFLSRIILEDPLQPGVSEQYNTALAHLNAALAAVQPLPLPAITRRICLPQCKCTATYNQQWQRYGRLFNIQ